MTNTSEAGAGHNSAAIRLPSDRHAAITFVWQRLCKLNNERRAESDKIRDTIKDYKESKDIRPTTARAALKFAKMTPEQMEKWTKQIDDALRMKGFTITIADENLDGKHALWQLIEDAKEYNDSRAELSEQIKEVKAAAKEAGLNMPALQLAVKLAVLPPEERSDWMHNADEVATILKWW